MQQLGLKYGFISNYDTKRNLRTAKRQWREWVLQYSPVVRREAVGKQPSPSNPNVSVSVREGFFYTAMMFSHAHEAENQNQWVISPISN